MLLTPSLPSQLLRLLNQLFIRGSANRSPPANSYLFAAAEVQCPVPTIPHGWLNPAEKNLSAGSTATLECEAGYVPVGSSSVRCLSSGRLQPRTPACIRGTHCLSSWSFPHAFTWVYLLKSASRWAGTPEAKLSPILGCGVELVALCAAPQVVVLPLLLLTTPTADLHTSSWWVPPSPTSADMDTR